MGTGLRTPLAAPERRRLLCSVQLNQAGDDRAARFSGAVARVPETPWAKGSSLQIMLGDYRAW